MQSSPLSYPKKKWTVDSSNTLALPTTLNY